MVLPKGLEKAITDENTGAVNLDAIHNGGWCYIILVMATCSEQRFRAERDGLFGQGNVYDGDLFSRVLMPLLGDTFRIDSP